ncbi:MAG: nickel pincer cofactor biosynthesis protein LarC [Bacteroidales bacterium]|jgi:uncharacterized protein (TIGR00299 family) protein|nr:nickel pincer cofactor biosynthesis protein LarC [Bacteroidales bacterium]
MRTLYYDCFAGISGDMNLGALVDLGVDAEYLSAELAKLNVPGFRLEVGPAQRRGIGGTMATVIIEPHEHGHKHDHCHAHGHHHEARTMPDIERLIRDSALSEAVKSLSLNIFRRVAEAEAKVHQCPVEEVHFHEVGALDSIADIVGAAICLDRLHVDRVLSSPVQLGGGMVRCQHGLLPVPAPATAEILRNIPVRTGLTPFEATTPTGAAILAATVDEFTEAPALVITATGYGIGQRDSEVPNVLRVFLCDEDANSSATKSALIECNIDDMNPEHYDFLMEQLFAAGAVDVWLTPVLMKKSRPAVTLSALCGREVAEAVKEQIFIHTTTVGLRMSEVEKTALRRDIITVATRYGDIAVKRCFYKDNPLKFKPEHDDCCRAAAKHHVSLAEVEQAVRKCYESLPSIRG